MHAALHGRGCSIGADLLSVRPPTMSTMLSRTYEPPHRLDLAATLAPLTRAPHDKTFFAKGSTAVRASRSPAGPATIRLQQYGSRIEAKGWGPGADYELEMLPRLLGADDDPNQLTAVDEVVADLVHQHPGLRL